MREFSQALLWDPATSILNAWNSGETTKPESEVIAPIAFRSALLHHDEVVLGRPGAVREGKEGPFWGEESESVGTAVILAQKVDDPSLNGRKTPKRR